MTTMEFSADGRVIDYAPLVWHPANDHEPPAGTALLIALADETTEQGGDLELEFGEYHSAHGWYLIGGGALPKHERVHYWARLPKTPERLRYEMAGEPCS